MTIYPFDEDCCPELQPFINQEEECDVEAPEIGDIYLGCNNEVSFEVQPTANGFCEIGYISQILVGTAGLTPLNEVQTIQDDFDDWEINFTYDKTTKVSTRNETFKFTVRPDTPDLQCLQRKWLGREMFVVFKIEKKSGEWVWMVFNWGGGACVTSIAGTLRQGFYEIQMTGEPNYPTLFLSYGSAAASEAAIVALAA